MRTLLLGFTIPILLFGCNKSTSTSTECKKDTDCKGDRICEQGKCVPPIDSSRDPRPGQKHAPPSVAMSPKGIAPRPSRPLVPSFPSLPTSPSIPQLDPGKLFKGLNLNLKLKLGSGKDMVTLQFKGVKNGLPEFEVCKKGKCEPLDLGKPDSLAKILEMLTINGANDPIGKMFQDLLKNMKQGPGFPSMPSFRSRPSSPNQVPSPPSAKRTAPYRNWEDIQKDGARARGAEAILGGLLPVQVSASSVVFKNKRGNRVEVDVPDHLKSTVPALAKTTKRVIAKIRLRIVTKALVRGTLVELEIPK